MRAVLLWHIFIYSDCSTLLVGWKQLCVSSRTLTSLGFPFTQALRDCAAGKKQNSQQLHSLLELRGH